MNVADRRQTKPVSTQRFQFDLSQKLAEEVEAFEVESGIATHREFFANTLSLWKWAARMSREGKIIAAIEYDRAGNFRYSELSMPALDEVRNDALAERLLVGAPPVVPVPIPISERKTCDSGVPSNPPK